MTDKKVKYQRATTKRRSLGRTCNNARLDDQVGQGLKSVEKTRVLEPRAVGSIHIFDGSQLDGDAKAIS